MRDLARRLLDASQTGSGPHDHEAVLVIERLRIPLTVFAGVDGFSSLLRRALVLARVKAPSLQSATVSADGRLEGLAHLAADASTDGEREAAIAITAQLFELLVTFIGEPLTLRLVRDAWPDTSLGESHPRTSSKERIQE